MESLGEKVAHAGKGRVMAKSPRRRTPSISDMFVASQKKAATPVEKAPVMEEAAPVAKAASVAAKPKTKSVQAYLDPAAYEQLATLAIREGTSKKALLIEAMDDLFRSHGLPVIADFENPRETQA